MLQTIQNDAYVASLSEETMSVQVLDSSYDSVVTEEGGFNCCAHLVLSVPPVDAVVHLALSDVQDQVTP